MRVRPPAKKRQETTVTVAAGARYVIWDRPALRPCRPAPHPWPISLSALNKDMASEAASGGERPLLVERMTLFRNCMFST